jgi:hypothetical protein
MGWLKCIMANGWMAAAQASPDGIQKSSSLWVPTVAGSAVAAVVLAVASLQLALGPQVSQTFLRLGARAGQYTGPGAAPPESATIHSTWPSWLNGAATASPGPALSTGPASASPPAPLLSLLEPPHPSTPAPSPPSPSPGQAGRPSSADPAPEQGGFDWRVFSFFNPDLRLASQEQAEQHYEQAGRPDPVCYRRAPKLTMRYFTEAGLTNQLFGHLAALAIAQGIAARGLPLRLVLRPAVERASFEVGFRDTAWSEAPIESYFDLEKMVPYWGPKGVTLLKVCASQPAGMQVHPRPLSALCAVWAEQPASACGGQRRLGPSSGSHTGLLCPLQPQSCAGASAALSNRNHPMHLQPSVRPMPCFRPWFRFLFLFPGRASGGCTCGMHEAGDPGAAQLAGGQLGGAGRCGGHCWQPGWDCHMRSAKGEPRPADLPGAPLWSPRVCAQQLQVRAALWAREAALPGWPALGSPHIPLWGQGAALPGCCMPSPFPTTPDYCSSLGEGLRCQAGLPPGLPMLPLGPGGSLPRCRLCPAQSYACTVITARPPRRHLPEGRLGIYSKKRSLPAEASAG